MTVVSCNNFMLFSKHCTILYIYVFVSLIRLWIERLKDEKLHSVCIVQSVCIINLVYYIVVVVMFTTLSVKLYTKGILDTSSHPKVSSSALPFTVVSASESANRR